MKNYLLSLSSVVLLIAFGAFYNQSNGRTTQEKMGVYKAENDRLVRGVVTDEFGQNLIPFAEVILMDRDTLMTDEAGVFRMRLPIGDTFTLSAAKPGYASALKETRTLSNEFYEVINLKMRPEY
ncbi:MAG: carboxypeptidase-like regulatory domain-containing protein [Bacteroidota bacterium]